MRVSATSPQSFSKQMISILCCAVTEVLVAVAAKDNFDENKGQLF
jgi:hypothetical protein